MASALAATLSYRWKGGAPPNQPAASVFCLFPVIIGAKLLGQ
jgi:hypothetical protein